MKFLAQVFCISLLSVVFCISPQAQNIPTSSTAPGPFAPANAMRQAQSHNPPLAGPTVITGVYNGSYRCARGPVNLKLTLVAPGGGSLAGVFTFDLPPNSRARTASFHLSGTYDAATGKFRLTPVNWEPPEPPGFVMVGMDGSLNSSAEQVSGKITYPTCTTFEATRNKAESAALANRRAVTQTAPAAPSARANANSVSTQTIQQPPSLASAAGSPAPVARPAEGTAPRTSAPQGQDPRVAQIPEPFRQHALDEIAQSKGYCQDNELISALLDCDCFSKMMLNYRIAHAKEYHGPWAGAEERGVWQHFGNLVLGVDCSECISDERISKWAAAEAMKNFVRYPDADKKYLTECVSRTFLSSFRAKPYLGSAVAYRNGAMESCGKQLRH